MMSSMGSHGVLSYTSISIDFHVYMYVYAWVLTVLTRIVNCRLTIDGFNQIQRGFQHFYLNSTRIQLNLCKDSRSRPRASALVYKAIAVYEGISDGIVHHWTTWVLFLLFGRQCTTTSSSSRVLPKRCNCWSGLTANDKPPLGYPL